MNLEVIHHVAIIVSDYAKSRHFYVDLLGFEVIREHHREDRNDYKLDLKLGSCELEIFGKADAPKRVNNPEACGLRHLAFKVECIEKTVAESETFKPFSILLQSAVRSFLFRSTVLQDTR